VLRVLGAKRWDVLIKVGLPRSMPYFYGSLKVAITLAFVGTTVSEMTAANEGIGYLLVSAGSPCRWAWPLRADRGGRHGHGDVRAVQLWKSTPRAGRAAALFLSAVNAALKTKKASRIMIRLAFLCCAVNA
jgi:hypothetical protein